MRELTPQEIINSKFDECNYGSLGGFDAESFKDSVLAQFQQLKTERDELLASNERMRVAMEEMKKDLLERAEISSDGARVVSVGSSQWARFKKVLKETPKQSFSRLRYDAVKSSEGE